MYCEEYKVVSEIIGQQPAEPVSVILLPVFGSWDTDAGNSDVRLFWLSRLMTSAPVVDKRGKREKDREGREKIIC